MSIKAILAEAEKTRLIWLMHEGKHYAIRACIYSTETYTFSYYDFILQMIKNQEHRDFINQIGKTMERVPLVSDGNGRLFTQDELDGTVKAEEFTSEEQIERLIGQVISVIKEQEYYTKAVSN